MRKKRLDASFSKKALKKYRTGKSPVKIDISKVKVKDGIIRPANEVKW